MVREPNIDGRGMAMAVRLRDEADVLLNGLVHERAEAEARSRATGRRDPLKTLTGASSLDRAIAATGQMLDHLDAIVREFTPRAVTPGVTTRAHPEIMIESRRAARETAGVT